jgi:exodeoxyribonuclease V alpha subunit
MTGRLTTPLISHSETALATGFSEYVKRLSTRLGASAEAAYVASEAARACIGALSDGDVCTDIRMLAKTLGRPEEDIRSLLFNSGVVASGSADRKLPLVLDDEGRIYLYRYFDYERQLADALVARIPGAPPQPLRPESRAFIDERFAGNAKRLSGRPDWQKIAVVLALTNPLTIISGGPGTGKTTIVTALIAAQAVNDPAPRIALAAPTGKAAARMEDAIRKQMGAIDPALRERLPSRASTIHMLLGASQESSEFRHHRDNPLPYDLVVVDEASMIDLSLAARLFAALPVGSRIVLLGDKDQLAAVEAGAVFAELARQASVSDAVADHLFRETGVSPALLRSRNANNGGLSNCVVWLNENYRFGPESPIGQLAALVRNSHVVQLAEWLRIQKDGAVQLREIGEGLPVTVVDQLVRGFEPYVEAVRHGDPSKALSVFETFCVLCAIRGGKRGVTGINDILTQHLRLSLAGVTMGESHWYHGRPVMVTENDYGLGIFNGDIGIALIGREGHLEVWFAARDGGVRSVLPSALPAHQTAFAMTVHKSQGSEFENVALVLPEKDSPVLTRELIYTAVTRAKQKLAVYGSLEVLQMAVARPTFRRGGLAGRIAQRNGQ